MVSVILLLKPYLEGVRYENGTNHHAILGILNVVDPADELLLWGMNFSKFELDFVHGAGIEL